jgi:hypothetical protein
MRALLAVVLAAAALGVTAPSASAKCSPDADPVQCWWMCTTAQLMGAACKDGV